ncbi:response regulator [Spirosoma endophyticum]|uniref:response regulator n=1 Tax=Spirosoma endophyticum TaxID=662367 RepID=UPI001FE34C2F|nr:response regulator [Spirosoma endophyticum]
MILLEINGSFKNGFETLEDLRSNPAYAHLPVIMLTTSSAPEDRQRSIRLGVNQFLTKPLGYESLRQMAHELAQQWALL